MKLTKVGFFKELSYYSESENKLIDNVYKFRGGDFSEILSYLKSGVLFSVAPGFSRDQLSKNKEIIGTLSIRTDGKFLWPSDLSYYFEKYLLELPIDFIKNMEMNNWKIPIFDILKLEI